MADSAVFDFICGQLEKRTGLDRLASRGTVRIALKQAGLDPVSVTPDQMAVVLQRVLPEELTRRGVRDAEAVCRSLEDGARRVASAPATEGAEAVFRRLGGGR